MFLGKPMVSCPGNYIKSINNKIYLFSLTSYCWFPRCTMICNLLCDYLNMRFVDHCFLIFQIGSLALLVFYEAKAFCLLAWFFHGLDVH